MSAVAIALVDLRRLFRQRSNVFFVLILPMLLILLLGATFGGGATPTIGVVDRATGRLGTELVAGLERKDDLDVRRYGALDELLEAVERGRVQAGVVVPPRYDSSLRGGEEVALRYYGRGDSLAPQLRATLEAVVAEQGTLLRAARFAESEEAMSLEEGLAQAALAARAVPGVTVRTTTAGEALFPEDLGTFDVGASAQLLLFVFLTSLTGAVSLIETRRLGLSRRMLSTPTAARTILLGEMLGRFGVALLQGLVIVVGSALLFGVDWGDPVAAAVLLVVFCLVGAGAGMLLGSALESDQQAGSLALLLGLGLAALGVYGVISRTTAQRTGEFGIRIALGAPAAQILRMVLASGARLALLGCGLGLLGALGVARLFALQFPGLRTDTVPVLIAVTFVLVAVAQIAGYLPARQASQVDPAQTLRAE